MKYGIEILHKKMTYEIRQPNQNSSRMFKSNYTILALVIGTKTIS